MYSLAPGLSQVVSGSRWDHAADKTDSGTIIALVTANRQSMQTAGSTTAGRRHA